MKINYDFLQRIKVSKNAWLLFAIWLGMIILLLADVSVRRVNRAMTALDEKIALNQEKYVRLRALSMHREEIESAYAMRVSSVRPIPDFESFLGEIETLNKDLGLGILNVKPVRTQNEGVYSLYSVKIEAQDDAADMIVFLHALTQALPGVGFERVEVHAGAKNQFPKASVLLWAVGFTP